MVREPERLRQNEYLSAEIPVRIFREYHDDVPLHWHEFYEISLVLSGNGSHYVNGATLPVEPGTIFFLTPADFHAFQPKSRQHVEIFNCIFTDEHLSGDVKRLLLSQPIPRHLLLCEKGGASIRAMLDRLHEEQTRPQWGQPAMMVHLVMCLVIELLRQAASQRPLNPFLSQELSPTDDHPTGGSNRQVASVAAALAYVNHHFRDPLTLAEVACYVGLSRSYLSDMFHSVVGCTFQHYLQDRRIEMAARLLHASEMSVTDVCYACGFNTLSHFTRVFKLRMGAAPLAYRHNQGH